MIVADRKPVPIYEAECSECHSIIQYRKSEALVGSINCPVCGIPIWTDVWADTIRPVRYEENEIKKEGQVKPTTATRQKKSRDDDISTYQECSYMRHPDRVEMGTY